MIGGSGAGAFADCSGHVVQHSRLVFPAASRRKMLSRQCTTSTFAFAKSDRRKFYVAEPDIIVIGGGSAGAAMTGRLASAGLKVTVIEAGATDRHLKSRVPALTSSIVQNPEFDWCFKAEPDETIGGRADIWPAGKLLGGGSALNGMMFIRGHQWDYDHWAEMGATGWDYQSVLPFFRRLEDNERGADEWRGKGGPIAVSEGRARYPITDAWIAAAEETGIERRDLNGEKAEGVDYVQVSQRNGERCSTASGYLHKFKGANRPEILLQAHVLRILIEDKRAGSRL
jgi:choline dehydrogenase